MVTRWIAIQSFNVFFSIVSGTFAAEIMTRQEAGGAAHVTGEKFQYSFLIPVGWRLSALPNTEPSLWAIEQPLAGARVFMSVSCFEKSTWRVRTAEEFLAGQLQTLQIKTPAARYEKIGSVSVGGTGPSILYATRGTETPDYFTCIGNKRFVTMLSLCAKNEEALATALKSFQEFTASYTFLDEHEKEGAKEPRGRSRK